MTYTQIARVTVSQNKPYNVRRKIENEPSPMWSDVRCRTVATLSGREGANGRGIATPTRFGFFLAPIQGLPSVPPVAEANRGSGALTLRSYIYVCTTCSYWVHHYCKITETAVKKVVRSLLISRLAIECILYITTAQVHENTSGGYRRTGMPGDSRQHAFHTLYLRIGDRYIETFDTIPNTNYVRYITPMAMPIVKTI